VLPFDTLKLADGLEAGGFSADQARAAVVALTEAATAADHVTKVDLPALVTTADLRALEQRLTIRFGGMLVVAVGVILAAIRYLLAH
jgi:hypothetical protein